jgi:hypothetical protein
MVDTMRQLQKAQTISESSSTSMEACTNYGQDSRCKCCYKKQNYRGASGLKETTKKEQKYYKLGGGKIKEENGKHHATITEGTNYK